jgi:hypothetical protein
MHHMESTVTTLELQVYATDTKAEHNIYTLSWFPAHTPMPAQTSSIDAAQAAATNLIKALQKPTPATPFAGIDTTSLAALHELSTIFQSSMKPPATEPDPASTPPIFPASAPRVTPTPTVTPMASPIPPTVPAPRVPNPATYAAKTPCNPNQRRQQAKQKCTAAQPPTVPPSRQHQHNTRFQHRQDSTHTAHHMQQRPSYLANAVLNPITGNNLSYRKLLQLCQ